ncbi:MAG: adenylate kinase [Bacteroidales bacterium]|jgi:adenylate kinase|nr:adenylate kinase [Bacteroidales bacterium]
MKFFILFGPPGAGKGTQAKIIVDKFNYRHVSTGDLLRKEMADGTELGKKAKSLIESGSLVDDYIVEGMIEHEIESNPDAKGFLFDGFPRTIAQAESLDRMLSQRGKSIDKVISFEISDEVVFQRIKHRADIEGRKDDADPKTIQNRIDTYHKKTEPLIEFYKNQGKYYGINGENDLNAVSARVEKLL